MSVLAEMEELAFNRTTTLARATPTQRITLVSIVKLPNVRFWDLKNVILEHVFPLISATAPLLVGKELIVANPSVLRTVSTETVLDLTLALAISVGLVHFVKPQKTNVKELRDTNPAMPVQTAPIWHPMRAATVAAIALTASPDPLTSSTMSLRMEPLTW